MDKDSLEYQLLLASRKPVNEAFRSMIYFLFDGDELVYIGQSKYGISRVQAHIELKAFTHYTYIPCPVRLLNNTEAYYILQFKPRYNLSLPGNEVYKTPKEAAKMFGYTIPEAREYMQNFDDAPFHEIGGNKYVSTYRVGYDDAVADVWFPPIERFSNEEVNTNPYLEHPVVDIRRCFSWDRKE